MRAVASSRTAPQAAAALILALVAAAATASGPSLAQQPSRAPVTIPFELAIRHVIVKARVNDSRPLSFALDTGAGPALVTLKTATELGLSLYGSVNSGGAGPGTQTGRRVRDATWSLVGLDGFSQPLTLALPMVFLSSALGRDADGIIGGEFIRQFVLELDYQTRSIVLHDRNTFGYDGKGETLPLEFTPSGHPIVKATVTPIGGQPIEHRFMLDIGSGLALALHSPFVAEHDLLGGQVTTIRAIGMAGAGGTSVGRLGRVAALQIGSFRIEDPITLFSQDKAGAFANASLAGNIGAQIASRFRMILDYGRNRVILEPSPAFSEPFDRAVSGIAVRAEGSDYHTFRVKEVLENSAATEAGIAVDDVITSIDGIAADRFTLTALNELLEKPVTRELMIRRGDQVLKIALTPRRLI
jgi:Aspartyl protease/PDZ domain